MVTLSSVSAFLLNELQTHRAGQTRLHTVEIDGSSVRAKGLTYPPSFSSDSACLSR